MLCMGGVQSESVEPLMAVSGVRPRGSSRRPSAFSGLWISVAASAFARTAIQLALSWITFEVTGSLFMVGVVAAVRMAPLLAIGIPAGIVADWFDRRRLVVGVTVGSTAVALGVAALLASGLLMVPIILAVALALGVLDT